MWLVFSLLSGSFYTIQSLLSRRILKGKQDSWAFSFFFSLVGALTSLPFMLFNLQVSHSSRLWGLLVIVGALIVIQNYLSFKATTYIEASLLGSINKLRLLWVLVIGLILMQESLNVLKVVGVIATVSAGIVVYFKYRQQSSRIGVALALIATVEYAVIIALYKTLFAGFNSETLTFFIFAIPAVMNFVVMPNAWERCKKLITHHRKLVFAATISGGLANLAMNHALAVGEGSRVLVIIEAFLLVVLVGEHLVLKESDGLIKKIVAVTLATAGAIMITLSQ